MPEGKDDFAVGEELSAAQVNQISKNANRAGGFKDTLNSGEAITGASLPVAIFVKTDNKVYACDANDATKLQFYGFALSTTTGADEAIDIQTDGVVNGFSGLTEGVDYYIQDDKTIGVSPGSNNIKVGKAISATEIAIQKEMQIRIGNASKAINDTSDQTITHNLGAIPKLIKISASSGTSNISMICIGSGTIIGGSNESSIGLVAAAAVGGLGGYRSTSKILELRNDSGTVIRQAELKSISNTTFVLQWNTNANDGSTTNLQWEVIG